MRPIGPITPIAPPATLLPAETWRPLQRAHELRIRRRTDPHQLRQSTGRKHPVEDFLFTYYSYRPAWLRQWHPGPDVILEDAEEFLRWPEYTRLELSETVDPSASCRASACGAPNPRPPSDTTAYCPPPTASSLSDTTASRLPPTASSRFAVTLHTSNLGERLTRFATWLRDFLRAVESRPPFFGCSGAHEWAMVYRQTPDALRHADWPLRFSDSQLAAIVESLPVCCTHFDAFRFFTEAARPLNRLQPTRETAPENDQRGCLHANMDLYKWAFKLAPYTPSSLLADCFDLAWEIREIDMRASPYDLQSLGYAPIRIETPEGRAEYESHQRTFAEKSTPLRSRLIALCDRLLA